ncbi:MAG: toxin [Alphaproteobacteria bacterium]
MHNKITYNFDPEKNRKLIEVRRISFEKIISALDTRGALDVLMNPNYAHQKMYVVELHDYIYLAPFVEERNYIFLKKAYPSRKAEKIYLID